MIQEVHLMQLRRFKLSFQDISQGYTTLIILEISQLLMPLERDPMFLLILNPDSLFLGNGKQTGIRVITCTLDIIYSKTRRTTNTLFSTILLIIIMMKLLLKNIP